MKAVKYFVYISALALSLSAGLVACGKASTDDGKNLTVGALTSDGNAVTSNISLSGYALSLAIQNITGQATGCYTQYGQQICNSQLSFTVTANNQQQLLQSSPRFVGSYSSDQRSENNIGGFRVIYQSKCYEQACTNVAVEVIFGSGYEYRQIVIKKDMAAGKIVNMGEWSVTANNVRSLSTIMQTL